MGKNDFFLGFAGHAHTENEIGLDQAKEGELRRLHLLLGRREIRHWLHHCPDTLFNGRRLLYTGASSQC
jgi:hypothetical protein